MLYCGRGQVKSDAEEAEDVVVAEEAISEAISEAKVNAVVEVSEAISH